MFYTFIWNFCPQLIEDGYVYAGVPPLYKITEGKDKYIYLKNDDALEEYREQNKNSKYTVNRMKGLGEMDADETEQTLINPATRTLKQITVEDVDAVNILFDQLMGTGVTARNKFIQEHSQESTYDI